MADVIFNGESSPKIKNGVLYFCTGDVFDLTLRLYLRENGEAVTPGAGNEYEVTFSDSAGRSVYKFTPSATISEGVVCLKLSFTEVISAKFKKGRYSFDVTLETSDGERYTPGDNLSCIVI